MSGSDVANVNGRCGARPLRVVAQASRLWPDDRDKPPPPRRILIIKPSSLGDVVHALPVLALLRSVWPQAHIAWLVGSAFAPLLDGHPLLDEVIVFDRRRYGRLLRSPRAAADFARFVWQLRRRRFDLVIDLQGLVRSGFLAGASGAPQRVGFAHARELAPLFYSQRVSCPRWTVHAVDKNLHLANVLCHRAQIGGADQNAQRKQAPLFAALAGASRSDVFRTSAHGHLAGRDGGQAPDPNHDREGAAHRSPSGSEGAGSADTSARAPGPSPTFPLGLRTDELAAARRLLADAAGYPLDAFIAVLPGARWASKRWSADRLATLVERLAAGGLPPVVLLGGPDDRTLAERIAAACAHPVTNLAGRTSLRELSAILAVSSLVICHDSGPMHIAAALDKPLVALFGPTNPARTGPYCRTARVVALPLDCAPCYRRECPLEHHACMERLDVDAVLVAVRERWSTLVQASSAAPAQV